MSRGLEYLDEDDFEDVSKFEKIRHRPKNQSKYEDVVNKKKEGQFRKEIRKKNNEKFSG